MARVTWSLEALGDLEETADFLGETSAEAAHRLVVAAFDATDRLVAFPLIGRSVPEFERTDLRELLLFNYRILYAAEGESVSIVAFVHGASDLKQHPRARMW